MAGPNHHQNVHFDPVELGRLMQSVVNLTEKITENTSALVSFRNDVNRESEKFHEQFEALDKRISELENRFRTGKGALIGIALALGFAGWGLKDIISGLFGKGP